jgi:hypothetical protein
LLAHLLTSWLLRAVVVVVAFITVVVVVAAGVDIELQLHHNFHLVLHTPLP